jgi:hypothetical protein
VLKVGAAFDYGSPLFLQLALYALEKRRSYLRVGALFQSDFVHNITELRVVLQNIVDLFPKTDVLVTQIVLNHGDALVTLKLISQPKPRAELTGAGLTNAGIAVGTKRAPQLNRAALSLFRDRTTRFDALALAGRLLAQPGKLAANMESSPCR